MTVPARIVALAGMEPGTRLDWIPTDREHVIEVRVHRNIARVAGDLRGRGARYRKQQGSAVDRLMRDRQPRTAKRSGACSALRFKLHAVRR